MVLRDLAVVERAGGALAAFALAFAFATASGGAAAAAAPAATTAPPSAAPVDDAVPLLYVRGQLVGVTDGYLVFTTGAVVRLADGVVPPKSLGIGSVVQIGIDQLSRTATLVRQAGASTYPGEVDIGAMPRAYLAGSRASLPVAVATTAPGASTGPITVTIALTVPANTPFTDDVYIATDRTTYGPAETRMQRVDGRHFTESLTLPAGSSLRYEFTRGTYATVERDANGGIVTPRTIGAASGAHVDDTVARWADLP